MSQLINKAKELMSQQTAKNRAPAWGLTEIAVAKGKQLAKKYRVDEELTVVSLYLAHIVFSDEFRGKVQQGHTVLSASLAKKYLKKWQVPLLKQKIILNSIEAHHGKVPTQSKVAEVVKNAECFKFLTTKGVLIYLHDLGTRAVPFDKAVEWVKWKVNQKFGYLTLKEEKKVAERNYKVIMKLLGS